MKSKLKLIWLATFGLALNPLAYADDDDDTIDVVENGETAAEYIEHMSPNENADFGTAVSNMVRDPDSEYQGREFGDWVAEQVREDVNQDIQRDERADLRDANADGGRPEG